MSIPTAWNQRRNLATARQRARQAHAHGVVSKVREAAPPEVPAETLAILEGSVSAVDSALASGEHDAWLSQLLDAEKSGKDRKTAISAIEARM